MASAFSNIPCGPCVDVASERQETYTHLCSTLEWKAFSLKPVLDSVDKNDITIVPFFESRFAVPLERDDTCLLQKWDTLDLRCCLDWNTTRERIEKSLTLWTEVLNRCLGIDRHEFNSNIGTGNLITGVRTLLKTVLRSLGLFTLLLTAYRKRDDHIVDTDILKQLDHCAGRWTTFDEYLDGCLSYGESTQQLEEIISAIGY
jgi:hypothetical protein